MEEGEQGMKCMICGTEVIPEFHPFYRDEAVCFHCAAFLEGVKMKKNEVAKVLARIRTVQEWFDDCADGEYSVSNEQAQELIEKIGDIENGKK